MIATLICHVDLRCPANYLEAQGDVEKSSVRRKTYGTSFGICERDCNSLHDCTALAYRETNALTKSGTCIFFKTVKPTPRRNEVFLFCKKIETPRKNYRPSLYLFQFCNIKANKTLKHLSHVQ